MIDVTRPINDWLPTVIYAGHRTGMPDIVMGRWPPDFGRGGQDQYKTWICETPRELRAVQARLAEPCPLTNGALDFRRGPDGALSGIGSGMIPRAQIVVGLYQPPAEGWPWLVLLSVPVQDPKAERQRYTWEALPSKAAAIDHLARMAAMMPAGQHVILTPEPRQ